MRILHMLLVLLAFTLSSGLSAQTSDNVADPLMADWALDLAAMAVPPEMRPRSVTISFADIGGGRVRATVLIVAPDHSERRMTGDYGRDGVSAPIQGDQLEADRAAIRTPSANVLVMAMAIGQRPASTRVYVVAPDGQSMSEQAVSYDDDGTPVIRNNRFTRITHGAN
jgi:hypothetical protein